MLYKIEKVGSQSKAMCSGRTENFRFNDYAKVSKENHSQPLSTYSKAVLASISKTYPPDFVQAIRHIILSPKSLHAYVGGCVAKGIMCVAFFFASSSITFFSSRIELGIIHY